MPQSIVDLLLKIPGFLLAISVHEYAHARAAYALGDDSPELTQRLTLEPWAHLDLMGAMMLLLFGFGWARPVPVNPFSFRKPRQDMAKVALAGPLANLFAAAVLEIVTILLYSKIHFSGAIIYLPRILEITAYLNVALAFFNLIPIPPLDGSRIVEIYLPPSAQPVWDIVERYGFIFLFVLVALGIVAVVISPLMNIYMTFVQNLAVRLSLIIFKP